MKAQSFRKSLALLALCLALVVSVALLGGCAGSDGSNGANGATGPAGPAGTPGTSGTASTVFGTHNITLGKVDATVSNVVVKNVGGYPKVSFKVTTASGPYKNLTSSQVSMKLADLLTVDPIQGTFVSAATGSTYLTDYFETWTSETAGAAAVAGGTNSTTGHTYLPLPATPAIDTTDAANGNYSYTFVTPFGGNWPGMQKADYKATNKKRLMIQITGDTTINNTVAFLDFAGEPAVGATATAVDFQRQFVTIQACMKCHSKFMDNAAHADRYLDTKACDLCHNPFYSSQDSATRAGHPVGFMDVDNAILPVFIHQIHASKYTTKTFVEQPITFPQDVKNCVTCHTNSGLTLGTGDKISNWKTNPTKRVCSSCHTTVNFTGASFVGLDGVTKTHFVTNSDGAVCAGCHLPDGTGNTPPSITEAHDTTPSGQDAPEYNVAISVVDDATGTAPAAGYFQAGDTPKVVITVTNANGSAIASDLTGTAGHLQGTFDPASLSVANLYVYGNRTSPRPVLLPAGRLDAGTTSGNGSATSINLMSSYMVQGRHSPFAVTGPFTTTDPNRTATATGWTEKLAAIPAGMPSGTYFARVYIGNKFINFQTGDYQAVSYALVRFQIGTATVEKRIAGNPDGTASCKNCHADTLMHASDHAAPFDTDHCNSCHYIGAKGNATIGAYGDPISNRVHAVHDANPVGDLKGYSWTDVTFPSNIERCVVCHNSGNTSYKTNLYEIPCYGCHADVTGATAHMSSMGGNVTSVVSGTTGTTTVPESCVVCHGPGRDADISD